MSSIGLPSTAMMSANLPFWIEPISFSILSNSAPIGMSCDIAMPASGFGHDRFHLVERHLAERFKRHRINVAQRSSRVELDPVGAIFHFAANLGDHRVARVRQRSGLGD